MDSLERFARIRAAIERGAERDAALREAELSQSDWIRLQRRWLGALAAEIATGDGTLAARYLRAFEGAQPALEPEQPRSQVEPAITTSVDQAPPFLGPESRPVMLTVTAEFRVPAGPSGSHPPLHLRGTSLALEGSASVVLPFRHDQPPSPATPPEPSHKAAPHFSSGTSPSLDVAHGPATPFGAAARGASTPRFSAATAYASETPSGPAMPFQAAEPEALGFGLMRYADLVAARDEPGANRAAVLAEFGIDDAAYAQIEAHWRGKLSTSIFHAANFVGLLGEAKKALAARRTLPVTARVGSSTVLALEAKRDATTGAVIPPPLPDLSVEQYAWLVAALRNATPAEVPATLTRLRLTRETRREVEDRWAKRMAADPALQERFLAALARHLGGGGS